MKIKNLTWRKIGDSFGIIIPKIDLEMEGIVVGDLLEGELLKVKYMSVRLACGHVQEGVLSNSDVIDCNLCGRSSLSSEMEILEYED